MWPRSGIAAFAQRERDCWFSFVPSACLDQPRAGALGDDERNWEIPVSPWPSAKFGAVWQCRLPGSRLRSRRLGVLPADAIPADAEQFAEHLDPVGEGIDL